MWKAFEELRAIGWIDGRMPRFVSVQAAGCAPIVKAFEQGKDESEPWPDPRTIAAGLRVPKALGDFLVLRALRESNGIALAVSDEEIRDTMRLVSSDEGVLVCPEGAAAGAAAYRLRQRGWLDEHDRVGVFNTGSGLKYGEGLPGEPERLARDQKVPRTSPLKEAPFEYQRALEGKGGEGRLG